MSEILRYWNRSWQTVRFDPSWGEGRVRWLARGPKECPGWAMFDQGCWYAVRVEADSLVFHVGPNQWPINDSLRCRNISHGGRRTFALLNGEHVVLQIEYDIPPELEDPATDGLDLATTDFLYWVAMIWNDPALNAGLKKMWRSAQRSADTTRES
jgi:hypothetical protein